jgi:hypothetical protein
MVLFDTYFGVFLLASAAVFFGLAAWQGIRAWWLARRRARRIRDEGRSHGEAAGDYVKALRKLENKINATVVDIIDDMGDVAEGRDNAPTYINFETAMTALSRIRSAQDGPIVVVLHTLGGYSLAAEMIGAALHAHKGKVVAYVPYVAMSAGTMVALACEAVHLGKHAALGPIDAHLGPFAVDDFAKLLKEKTPKSSIGDQTLLLAYQAERYQKVADARACALIHKKHKPDGDNDCRVVVALMKSQMPHDMRIDYQHAKRIGVNVEESCPEEVYNLVEARIQMISAVARQRTAA